MLMFTKGANYNDRGTYCVALLDDNPDHYGDYTLREVRHSGYGFAVVFVPHNRNDAIQQVSKRYLYKGLAQRALAKLDIEK